MKQTLVKKSFVTNCITLTNSTYLLTSLQKRGVWYILLQYLSLYALKRVTVYVWLTEVLSASF